MALYGKIRRVALSLPRWAVAAAALIQLLVVATLDVLTGENLGFSLFYVLPIAYCSWFGGLAMGLTLSFFSAVSIMEADSYLRNYNPYLIWNAVVYMSYFIIITVILHKLRCSYERERTLSRTDLLTGAMNRRAFREQAVIEIERSRRFGRIFTIAYIDLDNFKLVNDEFGHEAGDGLLKDLVAAIRRNTRASDVLCRLGGDEFAVLLPETGGEAALVAFSRVRDAYLARMTELDYPVTMSVGLITYKDMPEGFDAMLNAADNLMYEAKKSGKNCIKHTNA